MFDGGRGRWCSKLNKGEQGGRGWVKTRVSLANILFKCHFIVYVGVRGTFSFCSQFNKKQFAKTNIAL